MGTVRNFTPEVIGILAKNIDDNAGGFVDFFQDFRLGCGVFQDADLLRDIITRSNNYLRVFMEIEDVTHKDVLHLLDSVQEIEDRYCAKIRAATERMRAIRVQLQGFRDIMNTTVRNDTLTTLYGEGVSAGDIMGDPQKLAQARYDAEQKGLHFPLTAAQLAASEAAYQQLLLVHSPTGIGVGGYNQLDWVNEEDANGKKFTAAFANVACYATCIRKRRSAVAAFGKREERIPDDGDPFHRREQIDSRAQGPAKLALNGHAYRHHAHDSAYAVKAG